MKNQRGSSTLGAIAATILITVVLVVAVVGVWRLGWFVKEKNTDKQVEINNHNTGTQTAWQDEVLKSIAEFDAMDPANLAQWNALADKACNIIPRLTEPYKTESIKMFEQEHCT